MRYEEEKRKKKEGSFFHRVKKGLFGEEDGDEPKISGVVVDVKK